MKMYPHHDKTILMKVVMSRGDPYRASSSTMLSSTVKMSRLISNISLDKHCIESRIMWISSYAYARDPRDRNGVRIKVQSMWKSIQPNLNTWQLLVRFWLRHFMIAGPKIVLLLDPKQHGQRFWQSIQLYLMYDSLIICLLLIDRPHGHTDNVHRWFWISQELSDISKLLNLEILTLKFRNWSICLNCI